MNRKQQRRVEILTQVEAGRLSKQQAADLLGVTRRHVDNLLRRFRQQGIHSVLHGNTGRTPVHKTPPQTLEAILRLASEDGPYHDFSVPHLRHWLASEHGIHIPRSTLDRLLRTHGARASRRRKRPTHRQRRQRSPAEGMLVLIDASPHPWLEERGPHLTLLGAIDDATGKVLSLSFQPTETLHGYLRLLRHLLRDYGLPIALYHDRHTIFCSPKEATLEEQLEGRPPKSQFGAVLDLLGIDSICAHSPQAKGRIERLWGTLQERLVKEMRLARITTLEAANAFLPEFLHRHNAEFALPPADPNPVWVPVEEGMDLDYYLSERHTRVLRRDHTLSWMGQTFQLLPLQGHPVRPGDKVTVHRTPEETLLVYHGKTRLPYKVLETVPSKAHADRKPKGVSQAPPPDSRKDTRPWTSLPTGAGKAVAVLSSAPPCLHQLEKITEPK